MDPTRRATLYRLLFGPGLIGLRGLVSGLPPALLLAADAARPDKFVRAAEAGPRKPQFVIFSTSPNGDPSNANAPGTYADPAMAHATDPSMAATSLNLGGVKATGAKVWSLLPASMLAQTSFFHHGT